MDNMNPSYYAIIPASVRYDKTVPSGAKLLYGEISSLSNKEGYCWARNVYFAELYNTSERTIINWINTLQKSGYISVSYNYVDFPGNIHVKSRIIKITANSAVPKNIPVFHESADKTSLVTEEISREEVKISSPPGENNFTEHGKNLHEEVKISSNDSDKNFTYNTKFNNKTTTTPKPPENGNEPLPTVEKVVAGLFSTQELKNAFSKLDKSLIFDINFYGKAAAFLSEKSLDINYLSWLYKKCENKNPSSLSGLYYTLFTKDNIAEEYKLSLEDAYPEVAIIQCPACKAAHAHDGDNCPSCGLPKNGSPDEIIFFSELYKFTPEKRTRYNEMQNKIINNNDLDYNQKNLMFDNLNREFGLSAL